MNPVVIGDATLYCGDSLEILPTLPKADAIITDPIWPNVPPEMFECKDPRQLLQDALALCDANRIVICLRNDSDPRFMSAVPIRYKFLQAMWMRYACVGHMFRFLTGNEVAYAFGEYALYKTGRKSVPAIAPCQAKPVSRDEHPCPRSELHMRWLCNNWADTDVLDPFMGSGTTGVAALQCGLKFTGIELKQEYFDVACRRITEHYQQARLFA